MVSGEGKDTYRSGTVTGEQPLILAPVINPTAAQLVIENDFKRCKRRTSWQEEGHNGMMRGTSWKYDQNTLYTFIKMS